MPQPHPIFELVQTKNHGGNSFDSMVKLRKREKHME